MDSSQADARLVEQVETHREEPVAVAGRLYAARRHHEGDRLLEAALASADQSDSDPFSLVQMLTSRRRDVGYLHWVAESLADAAARQVAGHARSEQALAAYAFVIEEGSRSNPDAAMQLWELMTLQFPASVDLANVGARIMAGDPRWQPRIASMMEGVIMRLTGANADASSWPRDPGFQIAVAQHAGALLATGQQDSAAGYFEWLRSIDSDYLEVVSPAKFGSVTPR